MRTGSHFCTVSTQERDLVIARWPVVYIYEGPASSIGVYRSALKAFICSLVGSSQALVSRNSAPTVGLPRFMEVRMPADTEREWP